MVEEYFWIYFICTAKFLSEDFQMSGMYLSGDIYSRLKPYNLTNMMLCSKFKPFLVTVTSIGQF